MWEYDKKMKINLKSLFGYEVGLSHNEILCSPRGFLEDLITYQPSVYILVNLLILLFISYDYVRKKTNCSESLLSW